MQARCEWIQARTRGSHGQVSKRYITRRRENINGIFEWLSLFVSSSHHITDFFLLCRLRALPHCTGRIWKRSFIFRVRPTRGIWIRWLCVLLKKKKTELLKKLWSRDDHVISLSEFTGSTNPNCPFNGQFYLRDMTAGNRGSCIHRHGLSICFECIYHDSLQACLTQGIG